MSKLQFHYNENNQPVKLAKYMLPLSKNESEYNEAEKMLTCQLYDASDKELLNGRLYAKLKIQQFNSSDCLDQDTRKSLLVSYWATTIKFT